LAEHPQTMTHADVPHVEKEKMYISEKLIRLSIGVEYYEDIINDIQQAFEMIESPQEVDVSCEVV
jgi:methionine-gamma-lyase